MIKCHRGHNLKEACNCEMNNSNVEIYGPHKINFRKDYQTTKFSPNKRFVGVEIEIAKSDVRYSDEINKAIINKWKGVINPDGSLPYTGYEINTAPAFGLTFRKQILDISKTLKKANATTNKTCGLHVHVAAGDINDPRHLKNIARMWVHIEPKLYDIISRSRRDNRYCHGVAAAFKKELEFGGLNFIQHSYHGTSINLQALNKYKTVEFRLHHGTTKYSQIYNWSVWCANFIELASTMNEKQIDKFIADTHTSEEILTFIAPTAECRKWVLKELAYFKKKRTNLRQPAVAA